MCPVNAHGTFCLSTSLTFCFHPSNDIKWKNGLPCVSKSFIDLSPFVCLVFENFLILKLSFEIFSEMGVILPLSYFDKSIPSKTVMDRYPWSFDIIQTAIGFRDVYD